MRGGAIQGLIGEVAEWSIAAVLKTVEGLRLPGVRIPLSPPYLRISICLKTYNLSPPIPYRHSCHHKNCAGAQVILVAWGSHHFLDSLGRDARHVVRSNRPQAQEFRCISLRSVVEYNTYQQLCDLTQSRSHYRQREIFSRPHLIWSPRL